MKWRGIALGVCWLAGTMAWGQGTITDQAVTLTYGGGHWDGTPGVVLTGTEYSPTSSPIYEMGWFYRAEGDTREYPLPRPDTQVYSGARLTATWNNLHGKGFSVTEYTDVFDHERPSGAVRSMLWVTNNNATAKTFSAFHYVNVNAGGSTGLDRVVAVGPRLLRIADSSGDVVRYSSLGADHFEVAHWSGLLSRLNDAYATNLNDSGVPFGPGDAEAAFQRTITIPAGGGSTAGQIWLSSRLPTDYVRGGFLSGPEPSLLTRDEASNWVYHNGLRRTSVLDGFFSAFVYALSGTAYMHAVDDFDGDGDADWLSRDTTTGALGLNAAPVQGGAHPPPDWVLGSTGDFDGDGKADILWRSQSTQALVVWRMDGLRLLGTMVPSPSVAQDANWSLIGSADFNGDGTRDLLWRNETSRNVVIWYMDAALRRITGAFTSPVSAGAGWRAVAVGDFGKGASGLVDTADIVWQNDTSRKIVVWHMNRAGARTAGTFTTPDTLGRSRVVIGPR